MKNPIHAALLALLVPVAWGCGGEDAPACTGEFPEVLPGRIKPGESPTPSIYVSSGCPEAGADGTQAHAYPTLSAAIAAAPSGATVVVAAGTYAENLAISIDLSLVGSATAGEKGSDAAIILQAPDPEAITITGGANVAFQGFHVLDPTRVGVWAKGGTATLVRSHVEGTTIGDKGVAYGVVSSDAGAIILQDSAVSASVGYGAYVTEAAGAFTDSAFTGNLGGGIRLDHASSSVTVDTVLFDGNHGFGVGVFSSTAVVVDNIIQNTDLDTGGLGDGIVTGSITDGGASLGDAHLEAHGNTISASARVGILCSGGTRGIILQRNTITGSAKTASFGAGVWLQAGAGGDAANEISDNHVSGGRFAGIGLSGDTHGIILQNNEITGTSLAYATTGGGLEQIGDGMSLFKGASGDIFGNTTSGNGRFGIIVDSGNAATVTGVTGNFIRSNDLGGIILQRTPDAASLGANDYSGGNGGMGNVVVVANGDEFGVQTADFGAAQDRSGI